MSEVVESPIKTIKPNDQNDEFAKQADSILPSSPATTTTTETEEVGRTTKTALTFHQKELESQQKKILNLR